MEYIKAVLVLSTGFVGILTTYLKIKTEKKKSSKRILYVIILFLALSITCSLIIQQLEIISKEMKNHDEMRKIKLVSTMIDSLGKIIKQAEYNRNIMQSSIDSMRKNRTMSKTHSQQLKSMSNSQGAILDSAKTLLKTIKTIALNRRLIVRVSREIDNYKIYLEGEFRSTAPLCTLYVAEGNHTVSVKYTSNLGYLYEAKKEVHFAYHDSLNNVYFYESDFKRKMRDE